MRKRVVLIVAPLCAVALAAGVAVAAPSGSDRAGSDRAGRDPAAGENPDNPHAVRPIAASPSVLEANALSVALEQVTAFVQDARARERGASVGEVAPEEGAQAEPTVIPQSDAAPSSEADGDFLSCVRERESRGDYTVHNSEGSGASGAYQFLPGTWSSIADSVGRSDLVGMDPADASPEDQDAMAAALYAQQGAGPWGGGC